MKLSQLVESFVISNDEFEDYLNRATEQLTQELSSGKNARDAIHDLSVEFSNQHNKAYDAYVRMSDSLTARMHTLELDSSADMMNEPMADMSVANEPEMMTDPMGDMEMNAPANDEMPSDSDMEDYAAVMDNEPEVEESVNEGRMSDQVIHDSETMTKEEFAKKHGKELADEMYESAVVESEEKPYVCVHAKKGKHECRAKTSYEAAKKAAKAWGLKSTSGIDAHLAVDEGAMDVIKGAGKKIKKAGKKVGKFFGHGEHPAFDEFEGVFDESEKLDASKYHCKDCGCQMHNCKPDCNCEHDSHDETGSWWRDENGNGVPDMMENGGKPGTWCAICGGHPCHCPDDEISESMDTINQIVADKQAGKLHGMTVDMFTASAIKQIYDGVNDTNKAKLDDLLSSKEGVVKAAGLAMKMMKEGINEEKLDEILPAIAATLARGALVRGVASGAAKAVGGLAGAAKNTLTKKNTVSKPVYEPRMAAEEIVSSATRKSFSEYNEFYKELDKAAKQGKKAGDTISVGGKNIKLKSDPKQMHQLSDSDMDAIDALAQRLNEKGCGSHKKKY